MSSIVVVLKHLFHVQTNFERWKDTRSLVSDRIVLITDSLLQLVISTSGVSFVNESVALNESLLPHPKSVPIFCDGFFTFNNN